LYVYKLFYLKQGCSDRQEQRLIRSRSSIGSSNTCRLTHNYTIQLHDNRDINPDNSLPQLMNKPGVILALFRGPDHNRPGQRDDNATNAKWPLPRPEKPHNGKSHPLRIGSRWEYNDR